MACQEQRATLTVMWWSSTRRRSARPVLVISVFQGLACPAPHETGLEARVLLSEVRTQDGDPIELRNDGNTSVDLSGWRLEDEEGSSWPFVEDTVLEANALLVLWRDHDHDLALGDSDSLFLVDSEGITRDSLSWQASQARPAFCRLASREEPQRCTRLTLGAPNHEDPVTQALPLWIADTAAGTPLKEVNELSFQPDGTVWVGDVERMLLAVYDTNGNELGVVGEGDFRAATDGGKQGPEAIRQGPDGEVFVVDRAGRRVQVYSTSRQWLHSFDIPETEDPTGLVVDDQGAFIIADQASGQLHQYSVDGTWMRILDENYRLDKTETLALIEGTNTLFATSEGLSRVDVFDLSSGLFQNSWIGEAQEGPFPQPGRLRDDIEGIAIDPLRRRLYLSDEYNGRVLVHDLDSPHLYERANDFGFIGAFGVLGSQPGMFDSVDGIAVDPQRGLLAVADQGNGRVQVFDLDEIEAAIH